MVASIQQKLTFEEFLNWDDGSDRAFELIQGIAMPLREPTAEIDPFPNLVNGYCNLQALKPT